MKSFFSPVFFLLVLLFFATACGKDENPVLPEVEFLQPASGSEFQVFDTIAISIRIESKSPAADVMIRLENSNYIPVLPMLSFRNLESGMVHEFIYPVDKTTLESGNYLLKAAVSAGGQQNKAYLPVNITAPERQLEQVWLVTQSSPGIMKVFTGNDQLEFSQAFQYPGVYCGSDISPAYELFFLGAAYQGDLAAFNTKDHEIQWEVAAINNPQQPYFTLVNYHESRLYAGLFEGHIKAWNMSGQSSVATQQNAATIPGFIYFQENYLVVISRQKSNETIRWIEVYYSENGSLHLQQSLDFDPVVLSPLGNGKILILGNKNNKAVSGIFDPADGHVGDPYQPFDLPDKLMICGTPISETHTLFTCQDGIYIYEYQFSMTRIADHQNISIIDFETLNRLIWTSNGTDIFVLNEYGQLIRQTTLDQEIKNIHFLYNR